ncbi:integrase core domain-containing protein [Acinetobacter piscicola]|uniref:integrase core domain-containing protein n=1 Tax=Acinetobacter piscicola TaxID=2006115 RepID=UPI0012FFA3FF
MLKGILKQEFLLKKPRDLEQARLMIVESIEAYNTMRPHLSLQYKTPDVVHQASINRL